MDVLERGITKFALFGLLLVKILTFSLSLAGSLCAGRRMTATYLVFLLMLLVMQISKAPLFQQCGTVLRAWWAT